jgi:hypothetical protein
LNIPRRRYCQYASVIAFSASYFVIFAVIMQRGYWSAEAAEPGEFFRIFLWFFFHLKNSSLKFWFVSWKILIIFVASKKLILQLWYFSLEKNFKFLDCLTFGCRLGGKLDDLTVYKMFIGTVNIALGAFFVFIYFRFARKASMKKENRVSFVRRLP